VLIVDGSLSVDPAGAGDHAKLVVNDPNGSPSSTSNFDVIVVTGGAGSSSGVFKAADETLPAGWSVAKSSGDWVVTS
jgi:hypothetical protein